MVNFSLEGKIALVTGASYGIGFAIASGFAKAGATIVFNDIKQELVDKGLAAYQEAGIKAHGYVCDVTNEEQVNALVAQIEKEVGAIDILVNNAGIIENNNLSRIGQLQFRGNSVHIHLYHFVLSLQIGRILYRYLHIFTCT